ncbi:MAG: cytochrome c [Burkholderiaceae bacterium]|nr:cytochrome c [Burkholderiaceae bacterium]
MIEARSADIHPPTLGGRQAIETGARLYAQMCVGCPLGPGVPDTALRTGLNPRPPELAKHPGEPSAAFWIVKHGVKASGMPAWGDGHDDRELWRIVAFVLQLPARRAERHMQLAGPTRAEHGHR